jgi:hypothetical protein
MTTWLLGNAPAPLVMLNRAPEEMSGVVQVFGRRQ